MAKMTTSGLASAINTYVASASIAGSWSASQGNFVGLLDKIAKTVTLLGSYNDKLPELDGDDLPLGKTIEEYFIDLTLPEAFTGNNSTEGAKDIVPALPSVESVCYSYSLGRKKIKTTIPFGNYERAFNTENGVGNLGADILFKLQASYDLTKYYVKKQLLGRFGDAAYGVAACKNVIAKPVDTSTGEAFLKKVKEDIESAQFAHEGGIAQALIGAAPELILFVKKGTMPSLEIDTFAGAFNREDLAVNCKVKVVEDFGTMTNAGVYAILCDPRGIKLHQGYNALRTSDNADGDFINYVKHYELTAYYSKYCFVKVYSAS